MIKNKTISSIIRKIRASENILLPISGRLDADGVGCALALVLKLKEMGKNITCICDSELTFPYNEFPGAQFVEVVDIPSYKPNNPDLVIVTDSGSPEKLLRDSRPVEPVNWLKDLFVINIDHHANTMFGQINFVRPTKEATATATLLLEILEPLGVSQEIATLLFAGLAGDSLFFKTFETDAQTFKTAARLTDLGADKVRVRLWLESFDRAVFNSIIELTRLIKVDSEVPYAYLEVPYEIQQKHSEEAIDAAQNYLKVGLMWGLRETQFALTLREPQPGFTKGSLRGNKIPMDLRLIAAEFGGGGHPQAAGFKINLPLAKASKLVHQKIKELYPKFLLEV